MKPVIMSVADHAYLDPSTGKLYILGTFTHILFRGTTTFPLTHHTMAFVVKIISEHLVLDGSGQHRINDDFGDHKLKVSLIDSDGQEITSIETPFEVKRGKSGLPTEVHFIWELKNITFQKAGEYQFTVDVNKEFLGSTTLSVASLNDVE